MSTHEPDALALSADELSADSQFETSLGDPVEPDESAAQSSVLDDAAATLDDVDARLRTLDV